MTEKEIYIEIAQRFIQSCTEQIVNNINFQETIGFKTYHAFESIAGAFNSHNGHRIPWKHEKKLNSFVDQYRRNSIARVTPLTIAQIAIVLNSMRNKYLYPEPSPMGLKAPKDQLTIAQAKQLTAKVNGIINRLVEAM
jgi:hypothetical protein